MVIESDPSIKTTTSNRKVVANCRWLLMTDGLQHRFHCLLKRVQKRAILERPPTVEPVLSKHIWERLKLLPMPFTWASHIAVRADRMINSTQPALKGGLYTEVLSYMYITGRVNQIMTFTWLMFHCYHPMTIINGPRRTIPWQRGIVHLYQCADNTEFYHENLSASEVASTCTR